MVCVGDDCMDVRTCLRTHLLGHQIDDVKLLEGGEQRDHHRGADDGLQAGQGDGDLPDRACAVQRSGLVIAPVDRLQAVVHDHNHEGQRQPQVDHRAADEGAHIILKPAHSQAGQILHPLRQEAELAVEHAGFPQQNTDIAGHGPGKHQDRLVHIPQRQVFHVQQICDQERIMTFTPRPALRQNVRITTIIRNTSHSSQIRRVNPLIAVSSRQKQSIRRAITYVRPTISPVQRGI